MVGLTLIQVKFKDNVYALVLPKNARLNCKWQSKRMILYQTKDEFCENKYKFHKPTPNERKL